MTERTNDVADLKRLERALSRKASALNILAPIGFVDAEDAATPGAIRHPATGVQLNTETLAPGAVVAEIAAHGERRAHEAARSTPAAEEQGPGAMSVHQHLAAVLDHGRVYVAGPMTGLPEWNFPAFNAEAARLRALGYHVENPAENPDPPCRTWEAYMRLALRQMLTCGTVALLPGWQNSRGAKREVAVAEELGLRVVMAAELTQPVLREHAPTAERECAPC